jgi:hypothetical protein
VPTAHAEGRALYDPFTTAFDGEVFVVIVTIEISLDRGRDLPTPEASGVIRPHGSGSVIAAW